LNNLIVGLQVELSSPIIDALHLCHFFGAHFIIPTRMRPQVDPTTAAQLSEGDAAGKEEVADNLFALDLWVSNHFQIS
jgi:hypothetical protein